jgi:hypothetical protein
MLSIPRAGSIDRSGVSELVGAEPAGVDAAVGDAPSEADVHAPASAMHPARRMRPDVLRLIHRSR